MRDYYISHRQQGGTKGGDFWKVESVRGDGIVSYFGVRNDRGVSYFLGKVSQVDEVDEDEFIQNAIDACGTRLHG